MPVGPPRSERPQGRGFRFVLWFGLPILATLIVIVVIVAVWPGPTGSPLLLQIEAAKSKGVPPYTKVLEIPPEPGWQRMMTFMRPGSDQLLIFKALDANTVENAGEIWDLARGVRVGDFKLSRGVIFGPQEYSPDGKWLASNSMDQAAQFINAETGEVHEVFRRFQLALPDALLQVAFSSDSTEFFVLEPDGKLSAFAVPSGDSLREFMIPAAQEPLSLVALPGKSQLAVLLPNKVIVIDQETGDIVREIPLDLASPPWRLRANPDGEQLIVVGKPTSLLVDVAAGQVLRKWSSEIWPQLILPGGDVLLAAVQGGTAQLLRLSDGEEIALFRAHIEPLTEEGRRSQGIVSATCSDDGTTLVTMGADETIRVWSLAK